MNVLFDISQDDETSKKASALAFQILSKEDSDELLGMSAVEMERYVLFDKGINGKRFRFLQIFRGGWIGGRPGRWRYLFGSALLKGLSLSLLGTNLIAYNKEVQLFDSSPSTLTISVPETVRFPLGEV